MMSPRQRELRLAALELISKMGHVHSGRMLSSIDLIEGLYFGKENERQIFKHKPNMPQWEERDFFFYPSWKLCRLCTRYWQRTVIRFPKCCRFFRIVKCPAWK